MGARASRAAGYPSEGWVVWAFLGNLDEEGFFAICGVHGPSRREIPPRIAACGHAIFKHGMVAGGSAETVRKPVGVQRIFLEIVKGRAAAGGDESVVLFSTQTRHRSLKEGGKS